MAEIINNIPGLPIELIGEDVEVTTSGSGDSGCLIGDFNCVNDDSVCIVLDFVCKN